MPHSHPQRSCPLNLDETKKLLLDLVSNLDRFCREHDLRYALAYGSLIGAIRHKGFIPWDDDIDVWMPRPDYMRLLKEYPAANPNPYYEIRSMENDVEFPLNFGKFCDTRTLSIDEFGNESPIAIDIYILDGIGDSLSDANAFVLKEKRIQKIWSNQLFSKKLKVSRQYNLKKNLLILLGKAARPFISFPRLVRRNLSFKQSLPISESRYCASLDGAFVKYETKDMLEYTDAPFEGRMLRVPANYDRILRILYGDYLQLPPEDKRVITHGSVAYWVQE